MNQKCFHAINNTLKYYFLIFSSFCSYAYFIIFNISHISIAVNTHFIYTRNYLFTNKIHSLHMYVQILFFYKEFIIKRLPVTELENSLKYWTTLFPGGVEDFTALSHFPKDAAWCWGQVRGCWVYAWLWCCQTARSPATRGSHIYILPSDSLGCPHPVSYLVEELVPARGAAPQHCRWQVWRLCLPSAVAALADVRQGRRAPLIPPVFCESGGKGVTPRARHTELVTAW